MWKWLVHLFGSKRERDIARLKPIVAEINRIYAGLRDISDQQLRERTASLRARIQEALAPIQKQREETESALQEAIRQGDIPSQEQLFKRLDDLRLQRNRTLEGILTQLLPEAFAIVRETARRLTENKQLRVPATEWDYEMAQKYGHIRIENGMAIWPNRWKVRGHEMEWNMIHYDVQLMGGIVLHEGKIAEMATGEGKTLVATLPAYLNGLTGLGMHIVTVNDYLAKRDAEWNGPLLAFHGLRVDCIDYYEPHSEGRKNAYKADITYGTNNEFGFDYLRDNMVTAPEQIVQREHHYAIVDEVDSVLIDEARTPLIISGPVQYSDHHLYQQFKPLIERLVQEQRRMSQEILHKAKKLIAEGKTKPEEAGKLLLRIHRTTPKYRPFMKYLAEPGIMPILEKAEAFYLQDNARRMPEVDEDILFVVEEKNHSVELTDKGIERIAQYGEDPALFTLPDLASSLSEIDGDATMTYAQKAEKKETLYRSYAEKAEKLHAIQQLLRAYVLYERDVDYVVMNGQVLIVDEHTGRILPGRRYSEGLHQAIEAKEGVRIEGATQTWATVTLQNYFRMYHKLAGMTGTAETEAKEFYDIYKLDVVVIPTNKPVIRKDHDTILFRTQRAKYNAIIEEIRRLYEQGRPVLVGTTSVETSELLSRMLKMAGIPHNVLNAKHHEREAEIVAQAGLKGAVTIATNMAGRGTDIKLGLGVAELGGLAVIGTEHHQARRIDNQLRGRSGRQGDPGTSQFYASIEDDLLRLFNYERMSKWMDLLKFKEDESIQGKMVTRTITNAQMQVERNHFGIRKRLLEYDEVMNHQRKAIYARRRSALFGDRLQIDLSNMLSDLLLSIVSRYSKPDEAEAIAYDCVRVLAFMPQITPKDLEPFQHERIATLLHEQAYQSYRAKRERINRTVYEHTAALVRQFSDAQWLQVDFTDGNLRLPVVLSIPDILHSEGQSIFTEVEKMVTLSQIDQLWVEHLRQLDDLRHSVQTAVYEQKDPLLVYKFEAFKLFEGMIDRLNQQVLSLLFRLEIYEERQAARQQRRERDLSRLKARQAEDYYFSTTSASAPAFETTSSASVPEAVGVSDMAQPPLSRRERRALERQQKKKKGK
ncbi:MAG: preprotein translocase subunit SecA [Bacteroidia bacterium]|nr:preprotein translocase subunit SecA [Bacteroidia bacterium]MDW8235827.1 preprotein translocase subunit SecA [Bacteroidia bacterium]